ncbi:hypothetical protein B0H15DRAFT_952672 [Mycena belliarum]|uniref:Uncharacterized protein n=1 Tax=Mycena belliarum TaxID=1033014 RepID=A0AAD6XNC3_9AGAR|nr:hypothetical protein B0H15DRAFT_952672 [Mycena belliae]
MLSSSTPSRSCSPALLTSTSTAISSYCADCVSSNGVLSTAGACGVLPIVLCAHDHDSDLDDHRDDARAVRARTVRTVSLGAAPSASWAWAVRSPRCRVCCSTKTRAIFDDFDLDF